MKPIRALAPATGLATAFLAPALLLAAEPGGPSTQSLGERPLRPLTALSDAPGARGPQRDLAVAVSPDRVRVGGRARFRASVSGARASSLDGFRWDLDGDGSFETDTGRRRTAVRTFAAPGKVTARVRALDRDGSFLEAATRFTVVRGVGTRTPGAGPVTGRASRGSGQPEGRPSSRRRRGASAGAARRTRAGKQVATTAASQTVSIRDFAFDPRTTTIEVGDEVTWVNRDPTEHTATARNGSFDTGLLGQGRRASHRFTTPGTFSYYCRPHPNMKATVVVRRSGGGGGGGSRFNEDGGGDGAAGGGGGGGSGDDGGDAGSADRGSGGSLAQTGTEPLRLMGLGALLLAAGVALRLRLGRRPAGAL